MRPRGSSFKKSGVNFLLGQLKGQILVGEFLRSAADEDELVALGVCGLDGIDGNAEYTTEDPIGPDLE